VVAESLTAERILDYERTNTMPNTTNDMHFFSSTQHKSSDSQNPYTTNNSDNSPPQSRHNFPEGPVFPLPFPSTSTTIQT
jgi:hypothetical protein